MLNRQVVLEKLERFLKREISKADVHTWALGQAVSRDFENVAKTDPLIKNTVLSLIDISHDDLKRIPSMRALEYYRLCLKGQMVFDPVHANLESIIVPQWSEEKLPKTRARIGVEIRAQAQYLVLLKAYVLIFGLCALALQVISVLNPQFLHLIKETPTRAEAFKSAWPHIIYAILILLPRNWLARGAVFYFTFLALAAGMAYYWYISVVIVLKLSLHVLFILAFLPFSAIPATLALLLLKLHRDGLKRRDV